MEIKKVVNLTGHDVNVLVGDKVITYPKGKYKLLTKHMVYEQDNNLGLPMTRHETWIGQDYIPEQKDGVIYLVSSHTFNNFVRSDVFKPSDIVYKDGKPYLCRTLVGHDF